MTYQTGLGRIFPKLLREGLSFEQISDLESQGRIKLPPSLISVYEWHNGTDTRTYSLNESWFVPGLLFLPMEMSINKKRIRASSTNRECFPVLGDPGFLYYAVECSTQRQLEGRVLSSCEGETFVIHRDLETLFKTLEVSFREGVYFVRADGEFEQDESLRLEIAVKLNAGIPYWRLEYDQFLKSRKEVKHSPPKPSVMLFPDSMLAQIVGSAPLTRTQVTQKVFNYIAQHGLQDAEYKTIIKADDALAAVCEGKRAVSIYEIQMHLDKHLSLDYGGQSPSNP